MTILMQALRHTQRALDDTREELCNRAQTAALADRLYDLSRTSPGPLVLAKRAAAEAALDFKVQTLELFVVLFEQGQTDAVTLQPGDIEAFARKLGEVQDSKMAVRLFS